MKNLVVLLAVLLSAVVCNLATPSLPPQYHAQVEYKYNTENKSFDATVIQDLRQHATVMINTTDPQQISKKILF
jgi:hypothetical protein